jgi:hypothetical protein
MVRNVAADRVACPLGKLAVKTRTEPVISGRDQQQVADHGDQQEAEEGEASQGRHIPHGFLQPGWADRAVAGRRLQSRLHGGVEGQRTAAPGLVRQQAEHEHESRDPEKGQQRRELPGLQAGPQQVSGV